MKIFADGAQVFRFLDGRWRLTDAVEKFRLWKEGLNNSRLAELLFWTALNLAEDRRGGLLVVLDGPATASRLISDSDLLASTPRQDHGPAQGSEGQFHYFVRDTCVLNPTTT